MPMVMPSSAQACAADPKATAPQTSMLVRILVLKANPLWSSAGAVTAAGAVKVFTQTA